MLRYFINGSLISFLKHLHNRVKVRHAFQSRIGNLLNGKYAQMIKNNIMHEVFWRHADQLRHLAIFLNYFFPLSPVSTVEEINQIK